MTAAKQPPVRRVALWRMTLGVILVAAILGAGVLSATLLLGAEAPRSEAPRVHQWIGNARPWILALQMTGLFLLWRRWECIVRRAGFSDAMTKAWLAARNRMVAWGLALIGLGAFIWSAR